MARVTVEDCVTKVPNRFDLVMVASQRSREIASGEELTVERDNDKDPVVALREIADETVPVDTLREAMIRGMQKHVELDEPEDDDMTLLMAGQDWGAAASEEVVQAAQAEVPALRDGDAEDGGDAEDSAADEAADESQAASLPDGE